MVGCITWMQMHSSKNQINETAPVLKQSHIKMTFHPRWVQRNKPFSKRTTNTHARAGARFGNPPNSNKIHASEDDDVQICINTVRPFIGRDYNNIFSELLNRFSGSETLKKGESFCKIRHLSTSCLTLKKKRVKCIRRPAEVYTTASKRNRIKTKVLTERQRTRMSMREAANRWTDNLRCRM